MSAWASPRDVSNGQQDNNFTMTGAEQLGADIDVGELVAICVAENDRRLAPYDDRLKRPRFVPFMARLALKFIGRKKKRPTMKIGSPEHRDTFCRHFMQTYTEFDPETLPWPELDEAALQRLKSVPFWEEVFYTERRAGAIVAEFIKTVTDPVMKEAVALQGFEEARHAKLIRVMIEKYGIDAAERPLEDVSDNVETRFKDFGFGECMDSFLGFGVFKIAMQSQFLPKEMFKIFETLMYEETRHIVFFVNWMAYTQAQKGFLARLALPLTDLPLLHARAGPHDRHRQARQGTERRQGILRHPGAACSWTASPSAASWKTAIPKIAAAWACSTRNCCAPASCRSWRKPRWAPCVCGASAPVRCRPDEVGAQDGCCRGAAGRSDRGRLSGLVHRL